MKRLFVPTLLILGFLIFPTNFPSQENAPRNEASQRAAGSQRNIQDSRLEEATKLDSETKQLISENKFDAAIRPAKRAVELREAVFGPNALELVDSLDRLALVLGSLGDYPGARKLYERTLAIRKQHLKPDDQEIIWSLNNLGLILGFEGDYVSSRKYIQQSLEISERVFGLESKLVGQVLNSLSVPLYYLGEYSEAHTVLSRAQRIIEREMPDSPYLALLLSKIAGLYYTEGNYVAARPFFEKSLAIREKALPPNHPDIARSIADIGLLLEAQGDYDGAKTKYDQAQEIFIKAYQTEVHPDVARNLSKVARIFSVQGNYLKARSTQERAKQILENLFGPAHPEVARGWAELASISQAHGDYAKAIPLYERAIKIMESAHPGGHPDLGMMLHDLAFVFYRMNNYGKARQLYSRAQAMLEKFFGPNNPHLVTNLSNFALLNWAQKSKARAREQFARAGQLMNTQNRQLLPTLSFAEQRAYIQTQIPPQTSLFLSFYSEYGFLAEGYNRIFPWKGLLIDSLRRQTAISQVEQEARYNSQIKRYKSVKGQIAGLYHNAMLIPAIEWKEQNDKLTQEKEEIERSLAQVIKSNAFKDPLDGYNFRKFQQLLKSDEIFLDVYRYEQWASGKFIGFKYGIIVVPPIGNPSLVKLDSAKKIEGAISKWLSDVLIGASGNRPWQTLASLLWMPLIESNLIKGRKVWVSPDGELARIPWHLLPLTNPKTRNLLVTQVDSARELVVLRQKPTITGGSTKPSLLLVGDVDYGAGKSEKDPLPGEDFFLPLKGTRREVSILSVIGQRRGVDIIPLTTDKASKEAIEDKLPLVTYAHLATHGFFYREIKSRPFGERTFNRSPLVEFPQIKTIRNPLVESGIALAGANVRDPITFEAKGLLTAEEIVGFDLRKCDLITLSACNTGRGEETTGQGVLGLRSAIMAAGARSVLMSLWKVPDESTAKFMEEFYINLWDRKLTKAEALLRAQEKVRDDPSGRYRDPIHWAAWVLAGDAW